ncbi:MAG: hypothetical protein H6704_03280 [Myxococcales bacterium]|nr:hypothetical protein [Myxococcales bacterium]
MGRRGTVGWLLILILFVGCGGAPTAGDAKASGRWMLLPLEGAPEAAAVTDSFCTALARRVETLLCPGEVQALLKARALDRLVGCTAGDCLPEVGVAVGAERIVSGSVRHLEPVWTLELRATRSSDGQLLGRAAERAEGPPAALLDVLDAAAEAIVRASAGPVGDAQKIGANTPFPATPAAPVR